MNRILSAFKLNPYEQMNLHNDATPEEVRRQYRKVRALLCSLASSLSVAAVLVPLTVPQCVQAAGSSRCCHRWCCLFLLWICRQGSFQWAVQLPLLPPLPLLLPPLSSRSLALSCSSNHPPWYVCRSR